MSEPTKEQMIQMAEELDVLQKDKNQGRGVSCVQHIVFELHKGNWESACAVATWDQDKIRNYEDIDIFCIKNKLHVVRRLSIEGKPEHIPWSE